MTDLTTRRADERQESDRPPIHAEPPARRDARSPSSADAGVELGRFLALARLTAAQALQIGAGLAEVAARGAAPSGAGPDGDVPVVEPVVLADGRVVPGPTGSGSATTGRPLATVLADVVAAVPTHSPAAGPSHEQHLSALERAVHDLPTAGVTAVSRRLQEAAAAIDRAAVAALARAVGGVRGQGPGVRRTPGPSAAPAEPAGRPPWGPRSAGRRIGAWLLSIVVLAAVVVAEVVFLRDDIATDIGLLLDAGRSGDEPSTPPEPDGPRIPAPAPAAAGNVAAVDLRALGRCAPGTPCTVRFQVELVPTAEPQVVTWSYQVVDLCSGQSVPVPGGTVTVPAQGDRAEAVGVVALPPLDGVAVIAVTETPAAAASAPVLVGSCPAG